MNNPATQAIGTNEPSETDAAEKPKKKRGFAVMDPNRVKEIASAGGKAAHRAGTAHRFSTEEAREAGRKGGKASRRRRRTENAAEGT